MRAIGKLLRALGATSALLSLPAAAAPTAYFDYVAYRALDPAPAPPPGTFRNPVLPGFQPDPSIVRVGDDFYMVNSTFTWFPGLPIYHSTDLVHWHQIGNAITRAGAFDFNGLRSTRGLYAPSISHHAGRFWIVNTCVTCGGNFVITAQRPEGPWSDPTFLDFGGIDPSLFFGDDGRAWIVYNDAPPGKPRYDGHRALWLQRFDPAAMKMLSERHLLVNGGVDITEKPVWAEGPHIYHVGDWYYLMATEGGTADQHSEVVFRSRAITGPYVPGPVNPILTQRDLPRDRPDRVEATGHADIVQLVDGSWWGLFLGTRPFAGQSTLLGRETFLLPVSWRDGWPDFLPAGQPVPLQLTAPRLPRSAADDLRRWRDDFTTPLSPAWLSLRGPGPTQGWLVEPSRGGRLALFPGADSAGTLGTIAFVGRRLRQSRAQYTTRLAFDPGGSDAFAGLLAMMDNEHYLAFGREGGAIVARMRSGADQPERGRVIASTPYRGTQPIELRLRFTGGQGTLAWREASAGGWQALGDPIDAEPISTIHAGLFTGLVVGPYAVAAE